MDPQTDKNSIFQSYAQNLGKIISNHMGSEADKKPKKLPNVKAPKRQDQSKVLTFLKPLPWILIGIFLFSFYWDFDGITGTLFIPLEFDGLLRIISISGLIGFLTNWIAISMLFRPARPRPILGQGLIPAHKARIARRMAKTVAEDLINPGIIKQKIQSSGLIPKYREQYTASLHQMVDREEFRAEIKNWVMSLSREILNNPEVKVQLTEEIASEIEDSLQHRPIEKVAFKTYTLLRGKQLNEIIEGLIDEIPASVEKRIHRVDDLLDNLPDRIEQQNEQIEKWMTDLIYMLVNRLDIETIVEENIRQYNEEKLESMIRGATNEQLQTIQYLGAILGTIGGFVIWEPILSLGVIAIGFSIIYALDMWMED